MRGLNVPCALRAGVWGSLGKEEGRGARGALRLSARKACKRTAAQDRQAPELVAPWVLLYVPAEQFKHAAMDELPVIGLYVPCSLWGAHGHGKVREGAGLPRRELKP